MKLHSGSLQDFNYIAVCEKEYDEFKTLDIVQFFEFRDRVVVKTMMKESTQYSMFEGSAEVSMVDFKSYFSKRMIHKSLYFDCSHFPIIKHKRSLIAKVKSLVSSKDQLTTEMIEYKFKGVHSPEMQSVLAYLKLLEFNHREVFTQFQDSIHYLCSSLETLLSNDYMLDEVLERINRAEELVKKYYQFALRVKDKSTQKIKSMYKTSLDSHDDLVSRLIEGADLLNEGETSIPQVETKSDYKVRVSASDISEIKSQSIDEVSRESPIRNSSYTFIKNERFDRVET